MSDEHTFDLRETLLLLIKKRWVIIGIVSLVSALTFIVLSFMTEKYRSDVLLAPISGDKDSGLSTLAGQIGSIAGISSANLGSGSAVDKTTMALEVMQSRMFTIQFLKKYDLQKYLLLDGGWDADLREWIFSGSDTLDGLSVTDFELQGLDAQSYELFQDDFLVVQDRTTGMVTVSYMNESPIFARTWLGLYVREINNYMMEQDVQEAEESLQFLNDKLLATPVAEMRQVFYDLITEQTKTITLANARKEYVLKVIDPPVESRVAAFPKFKVVMVLSIFLGFVLSLLFIYFVEEVFALKGEGRI